MAKWSIVVLSAILGCTVAEPPSGYSYAPSSSVILVGGHGSSHSDLSSGGHYEQVPVGHQSSEGYHIDPHLLEKIKHIILKDEIQNQAYQQAYQSHSGGHGGHGISSHYGAPAPVYGPPHHHDRIVGIELDHLQQGIQVAQYHQGDDGYSSGYAGGYSSGYSSGGSGYSSGGSGYSSGGHGYSSGGSGYSSGGSGYSSSGSGYSSGGHGSASYSAPSISYTTIGIPSGSYGVPSSPSSSYGSPHHH